MIFLSFVKLLLSAAFGSVVAATAVAFLFSMLGVVMSGPSYFLSFFVYLPLLLFNLVWMLPLSLMLLAAMGLVLRPTRFTLLTEISCAVCAVVVCIVGQFVILPRLYISWDRPWCNDTAFNFEGLACQYFQSVFGLPWIFLVPIFALAGAIGGYCAGWFLHRNGERNKRVIRNCE